MDSSISEKVRLLRSKCIGCKTCDSVCPSHLYGGCTPSLVMAGKEGNVVDCISCGRCSNVCENTDPKTVMMYTKADLIDAKIPPVFFKCGYVNPEPDPKIINELPEIEPGDDIYVMPGCIAKRRDPFLNYASRRALQLLGFGNRELPGNTCCTYPIVFRTSPDEERDSIKKKMGEQNDRETIQLCAGCTAELKLSGIDFPHVSLFLYRNKERISKLKGVNLKVALQPGCSAEKYRSEITEVIEACGCTVVNDKSGCCGKMVEKVNSQLMADREKESKDQDVIVVCCPNCLRFYDSYQGGKPVLYLTELVCLAAGEDYTQKFHKIKLRDV